jgi:hypothetical protein
VSIVATHVVRSIERYWWRDRRRRRGRVCWFATTARIAAPISGVSIVAVRSKNAVVTGLSITGN